MISKPLPQREEYLKKKRNKKLIRYGIVIFLVSLIVGVTAYLSHRQEFRISKVTLSGGILVTEEEVQRETLQYLAGSHLLLFPKDNAFWYSKKGIKEHLKETFKRIDTIDVRLEGLKTVVIDITERKHFAMWCEGEPRNTEAVFEDGTEGSKGDPCYFLDQNGTVFAEAPSFSGDAYFKYYGLLNENPIGKEFMDSSSFAELSAFVETMKHLGVQPRSLFAKGEGEFSLFIFGGGEIYFDTKESLIRTADNLRTLLRSPTLATSTRGLPVEYIDLRFGNKLFYKLK